MRPLYPSAHHDRFSHSLGVYYLADMAFRFLKKNTEEAILEELQISNYYYPFVIAALMHDCGHAPFSHLFEEYYNKGQYCTTLLYSVVGEPFKDDYQKNLDEGHKPGAHEIFSAAILLKHYRESLLKLVPENKLDLIARMITGNIHTFTGNDSEKDLENCLITLINGSAIDVDKLDYILRDTWASGVNNVTIDVRRLLSALLIAKSRTGRLVVAFKKSALSVIQSVVDGRNFLHKYIYGHHIVVYYSHILENAFKETKRKFGDGDEFIDALFTERVFQEPVPINNSCFYLPTDGDLFYVMKKYYNEINEVKEFLGRKPNFLPLWKTRAEFEIVFSEADRIKARYRNNVKAHAFDILQDIINDESEVKVIDVKPKVKQIEDGDILIWFKENEIIQYNDQRVNRATMSGLPDGAGETPYFIIYVHERYRDRLSDCIEKVR